MKVLPRWLWFVLPPVVLGGAFGGLAGYVALQHDPQLYYSSNPWNLWPIVLSNGLALALAIAAVELVAFAAYLLLARVGRHLSQRRED